MKKTSRKERDTARRRYDIFRAAEEVFMAKGYHGATLEEIAGAAGYAVGTIYTYFKNKDDLYHSLIQNNTDELAALEDAAVADIKDPEERLRVRLKTVLTYLAEHRSLLAYHVMQPDQSVKGKEDTVRLRERMNVVAREIEAIKKKHRIKRINPLLTAHFMKGGMMGILPMWFADPDRISVDELVNDVIDVVVGGIKSAK